MSENTDKPPTVEVGANLRYQTLGDRHWTMSGRGEVVAVFPQDGEMWFRLRTEPNGALLTFPMSCAGDFVIDKPPTVEPAPVRRNCWTCVLNDPAARACNVVGEELTERVEEWEARQTLVSVGGHFMPPRDADNCPGWKPKPTAISARDIPGHRPNTDRAQVAHLGATRAPVVERGPMVDGTSGDLATTLTVNRADFDALVARVDALERRQRTDNARSQALRRRDKLRGTR